MAKITIVGVGPGSPDYVAPIARRTVQNAQLIIGAERALNLFLCDLKGTAVTLTAKNVDEVLKQAVVAAENGKAVALLSTGDPGFSGLLGTFLNFAKTKGVEVDVIPGISALQVCAARLCMCWDEANLFSFHKGTNGEKKANLVEAVKKGNDVMLLPDPKAFPPEAVAKFLIDNGVDGKTRAFVCENLTLNDEKVVASSLEEISKLSFGSLCVMVIRPSYKPKAKC